MALACRLLGLEAGDEVLVPAYNCGTEIDALVYAGVKPVGYNVTRQCRIDLGDLMARKTDRTRAVSNLSLLWVGAADGCAQALVQ